MIMERKRAKVSSQQGRAGRCKGNLAKHATCSANEKFSVCFAALYISLTRLGWAALGWSDCKIEACVFGATLTNCAAF